jgi:hypothetical protein
VIVLALDDRVIGRVGRAVAHRTERGRDREDRLGKVLLDQDIGPRYPLGGRVSRGGRLLRLRDDDQLWPLDRPNAQAARRSSTAFPDHRARLDRGRECPHVLGQVALEDEPPIEALLHLDDFLGQLVAQGQVVDLGDEGLDARHWVLGE